MSNGVINIKLKGLKIMASQTAHIKQGNTNKLPMNLKAWSTRDLKYEKQTSRLTANSYPKLVSVRSVEIDSESGIVTVRITVSLFIIPNILESTISIKNGLSTCIRCDALNW